MGTLIVISTIVGGITAIIIAIATWRYVIHTKHLVEIQIEPAVDIDIPSDALEIKKPDAGRIINNSMCSIQEIRLQVASSEMKNPLGKSQLVKCCYSNEWPRRLQPGQFISFDVSEICKEKTNFTAAKDQLPFVKKMESILILTVSFRRSADRKYYCFEEFYVVRMSRKHQFRPQILRYGPRNNNASAEKWIYEPVDET